jgi:hypothetical protein
MRRVCNDGLNRDVFGKSFVMSISDDTTPGIDYLFVTVFFCSKRGEFLVFNNLEID